MSDGLEFEVWTPRRRAADAARRWRGQYFSEARGWYDDNKKAIHGRLSVLNQPIPETVDHIIGNSSWTRTKCEQCEAENVPVIILSVADEYGTELCESCVELMLSAFLEARR